MTAGPKPVVYVAGPYSHPDPVCNTHRALKAADRLLTSGLVTPVVPHLTLGWHLVCPHPYQQWLDYGLEMLGCCDAVLRLDGESHGADVEVDHARSLSLPVFDDVDGLLAWAEGVVRISPPVVIGLGHRARMGKDSVAEVLVDRYRFERVAFGDPIKAVVGEISSFLAGDLSGRIDRFGVEHAKVAHPRVRDLLVEVGRVICRHVHADAWIWAVTAKFAPGGRYVVSDVRYPSEVDALRQLGAVLIRVERPGVPHLDDVADNALADYDGWDDVVVNDGSLDDLAVKVDELVSRHVPSTLAPV